MAAQTDGSPGFTYREVGATLPTADVAAGADELPPPGFHLVRVRTRLGSGPEVLRRAGRDVLGWRMHRAMGVSIEADGPEAEPGVGVVVGLGVGSLRLRAPCRVVWVVREADRAGFAYGTLPGHPACGEEAFLVERNAEDDSVWLTVTAFSRGAAWYVRAGGPVTRLAQRAYAHRCGQVLRRLGSRRPKS
ncbi:DUF1990 family protein [Streptomyces sp. 4N509B]|uniref:DUF1990 family protein n=1 Tax=Streptomyces sp. 4N509B TaxID=3457413 RepID=UPI003FD30CD1